LKYDFSNTSEKNLVIEHLKIQNNSHGKGIHLQRKLEIMRSMSKAWRRTVIEQEEKEEGSDGEWIGEFILPLCYCIIKIHALTLNSDSLHAQ